MAKSRKQRIKKRSAKADVLLDNVLVEELQKALNATQADMDRWREMSKVTPEQMQRRITI